jgi:hypothetical protein
MEEVIRLARELARHRRNAALGANLRKALEALDKLRGRRS